MQKGLFFVILTICEWKYSSGGAIYACDERSPSFNKCFAETLNRLIPTLKHGWNEQDDVPGLDPIKVPDVNTTHKTDAMDVTLLTQSVYIRGLSNARVQAIKSKNLFMGKMEIVLKVPQLNITGRYSTEGEIATFPLSSSGHFRVIMDDVTVVCILYLEKFTMGNDGRFIVSSISLDAVPGQIHIKPAPFLDGDENLGKTLEVYLNENSYELYNMVKPKIMNFLSDLARIMIDSYMTTIPENHIIDI